MLSRVSASSLVSWTLAHRPRHPGCSACWPPWPGLSGWRRLNPPKTGLAHGAVRSLPFRSPEFLALFDRHRPDPLQNPEFHPALESAVNGAVVPQFLGQELRIMIAFAEFDTQVFLTQFMRQSMRIRDRLADRAEDLIRHRQRNRIVQFLVGDPGVAGFLGYALAWPTSLLPSPSLAEGLVRCQFQGSSLQSWTPHPDPPLPASISPPGTQ